jgi:hypothetical protein
MQPRSTQRAPGHSLPGGGKQGRDRLGLGEPVRPDDASSLAPTSAAAVRAVRRLAQAGQPSLAWPPRLLRVGAQQVRQRRAHAVRLRAQGPAQRLRVRHALRARARAAAGKLRALIDPVEDQIRLYRLDERVSRSVVVTGARVIEERPDFWIVT